MNLYIISNYFLFTRHLSSTFRQEVFSLCLVDTLQLPESQHHLSDVLTKVAELSGSSEGLTDKLVHILARTLFKLLPCVILNKREVCIKFTLNQTFMV